MFLLHFKQSVSHIYMNIIHFVHFDKSAHFNSKFQNYVTRQNDIRLFFQISQIVPLYIILYLSDFQINVSIRSNDYRSNFVGNKPLQTPINPLISL